MTEPADPDTPGAPPELKLPGWMTKWHDTFNTLAGKQPAAPDAETPAAEAPPSGPPPATVYEAVLRNDLDAATRMFDAGTLADEKSLAYAVERKLHAWAQTLIKKGALPTTELLYTAAVNDDLAMADILLTTKSLLGKPVRADQKTLNYVVSHQMSAWVAPLVKAGALPTTDMVMTANAFNDAATAQALLKAGAKPPRPPSSPPAARI